MDLQASNTDLEIFLSELQDIVYTDRRTIDELECLVDTERTEKALLVMKVNSLNGNLDSISWKHAIETKKIEEENRNLKAKLSEESRLRQCLQDLLVVHEHKLSFLVSCAFSEKYFVEKFN